MKVIRRAHMVEATEAHDPEIGHGQGVPPRTAADGAEIHSVDIPVFELEVERRFIDRETHRQVVLGGPLQICDDRVSVEDEVGAGAEPHQWMQGRIIIREFGALRVSGG